VADADCLLRLELKRLPFQPRGGGALGEALASILERRGRGAEMLGWLDLPLKRDAELERLRACAGRLRDDLDAIVVIGIGGSYLGAKAALEALGCDGPEIFFAGHHLEASYYEGLLKKLRGRAWGIHVISKSGTTTEPALAFRIFREALEQQVGAKRAASRIVATTDGRRGALLNVAEEAGFERFVVPDDVGGRFSVLTPVGLFPLAIAGVDIDALLDGAARERERCLENGSADPLEIPSVRYAAARHELYMESRAVEILASFHPSLHFVAEWWKQLFGESEGKEGEGLFPAAVDFTTDLHSLGQYIQDGPRHLIESFLDIREPAGELRVPQVDGAGDGLDYLAGRRVAEINRQALQAVADAHAAGGCAVQILEIPRLDAACLGAVFYFFEFAVAVGGRLLGVNPFDQPGVEAYKTRLFHLLGKPGH